MTIRIATLNDKPALDQVFARSYPVLLADAYDADVLSIALPLMTQAQPALLSSGTYYVWDANGTILGAGGWSIDPQDHAKGHIRHVVTDPDALGQGIARGLIERSLARAKAAGVSEMECWSTRNAEGFYHRLGFKTVGLKDVMLDARVPFPSVRMVRDV